MDDVGVDRPDDAVEFSGGFMGDSGQVARCQREIISSSVSERGEGLARSFRYGFCGRQIPANPGAKPFIWLRRVEVDAEIAFRRTGENHRWMYDRVPLGGLLGRLVSSGRWLAMRRVGDSQFRNVWTRHRGRWASSQARFLVMEAMRQRDELASRSFFDLGGCWRRGCRDAKPPSRIARARR